MPTAAVAQGAEPLVAQILAPSPSFKFRPGRTAAVRIRVEGGNQSNLSWSLSLRLPAEEETVELARGTAAVQGAAAAELVADELSAGSTHTLVLTATDAQTTASAEASFLVTNPTYTLIPLEDGNYSRVTYGFHGGDAAGDLLLYSGGYTDPEEIVLLTRLTGQRETVIVDAVAQGIKLSGDGTRLFFKGFHPRPGTEFNDFGLGFLDLVSRAQVLVGPEGQFLYSTDAAGKRVVYQAPAEDRTYQFFLYDEVSGDRRQLTDDPEAIDRRAACPTISGSTPLITADGSTVVLITPATLGLVPEDDSVGCRVFAYEVEDEAWRHVTALPASTTLGRSALSTNGRWLSFAVVRPLPGGGSRAFPVLVDVESGEVHDPLVDVGDFTSFDSFVTGDGRGVVISTQADLDPRVGNADHNLELFFYDRESGEFSQITETTDGIGRTPGGCPSYRPYVSRDGSLITLQGFVLQSIAPCRLDGPQRNEGNGFWLRRPRAVRRRPGNHRPVFEPPADQRVAVGETLTLEMSAIDPDGDPLSFFAQVVGGFDVPPGSEITDHHDGTATFRWPTRPEHAGNYELRVAVFDEGGGEVLAHRAQPCEIPG